MSGQHPQHSYGLIPVCRECLVRMSKEPAVSPSEVHDETLVPCTPPVRHLDAVQLRGKLLGRGALPLRAGGLRFGSVLCRQRRAVRLLQLPPQRLDLGEGEGDGFRVRVGVRVMAKIGLGSKLGLRFYQRCDTPGLVGLYGALCS